MLERGRQDSEWTNPVSHVLYEGCGDCRFHADYDVIH